VHELYRCNKSHGIKFGLSITLIRVTLLTVPFEFTKTSHWLKDVIIVIIILELSPRKIFGWRLELLDSCEISLQDLNLLLEFPLLLRNIKRRRNHE